MADSTPILEHRTLFIGGRWTEPAGRDTIEVISPVTERPVGRVPHATPKDVDRAVAAAREAFDNGPWPRMTIGERIEVVTRVRDGLLARHRELAELVTLQNGCPITVSVRAQALSAVAAFGTALTVAAGLTTEEERPGLTGPLLVRREPVGVVAAVTPWNVPQLTIAGKLAPALLAGCAVVLKPSPETPLDAYLLAEVCESAGLPEGVLSVLPADRETSAYLVAHPGVDKVAFTGSVGAGKQIMAAAAGNLTRVTLELGGKSAAILLEDADLDAALPNLVLGAFANSGQACVALTRILAPASRYDEIAARLTAAVTALKVGDPFDPATAIGPLVTEKQRQRSLDYIRIGRQEGAALLAGGGVPEHLTTGWYVEPTLFGDVDNAMRIAQEEIFGPVVCLIRYQDEADAVRIADDSPYGLAGTVWAGTDEHGTAIARRIRTGTYSVNCQRFDVAGPFGGYKNSGIGREFGPEGLSAYLETKTIHLPAPARA
ncbi:aldehyde dehydrogenase [Streptomyces yaizuensis]|uniref:aldehyde dehydrogenase (NAD(+)) n=1 Tax=Streptomyces yaizuensis TaxID=2989713 RepID=A0ABQ5NSW7_9ACTN|nr:aldehyde dehydrogenase [Streptomyces sp. YSPA8]GLF93245.1 aldehyde dehydrogenase [Streptomyces sp. YSPA8]